MLTSHRAGCPNMCVHVRISSQHAFSLMALKGRLKERSKGQACGKEGGMMGGRVGERREGERADTDQHADKPVVVNQKLYYSSPLVGADSNSTKF